ncbi:MAG: methionine--tRNA ligase [Oligoflexia bacterium]|nr:methionine--tRNA ligase [Oligoflexia bacterium]
MTRYLITSALPYINGVKHLGNLVGSMLPADVYARYLRRRGRPVLYLCATDEHGTPAELAASEEGIPVGGYCKRQYDLQKAIYKRFDLSFDYFGRTSSVQNHRTTQHIYRSLRDRGYIDRRKMKQLYSPSDGRFLPDRYVLGICPKCGDEQARGDQCDACLSLLEPTDLIKPRSAVSGSCDLEVRETEHLYLKLSSFESSLRKWVNKNSTWPLLTRSVALKWLNEGLRARCITRDLQWGVPVPEEDMANKVFYVWFDAPIGYISAAQEWAESIGEPEAWRSWWENSTDVHYAQFMAKDNLPFHTVFFPAMLMGTGESWKQPDMIKAFNWLTYEGGKFSTRWNRGVFLDKAIDLFPSDYWRWMLLASAPESSDSSFTWNEFQSKVNKDLNDRLGNQVLRVLKLCAKQFGTIVPEGGVFGSEEIELEAKMGKLLTQIEQHYETLEFRYLTQKVAELWSLGNNYFDRCAPWKKELKSERRAVVLRTSINVLRLCALVAEPIIPKASRMIWDCLGEAGEPVDVWGEQKWIQAIPPGKMFKVPESLFQKVSASEVTELTSRFAGSSELN